MTEARARAQRRIDEHAKKGSHYGPRTGESLSVINSSNATLRNFVTDSSNEPPDYLRTFFVLAADDTCFPVFCLPDTGALQDNFMSPETAQWLQAKKETIGTQCELSLEQSSKKYELDLGGTGITITTSGSIACKLKFLNEVTNEFETTPCLEFKIIPTEFDIIIGRISGRKLRLGQKIPSYYSEDDVACLEETECNTSETTCSVCVRDDTLCPGCAHSGSFALVTRGRRSNVAKTAELESRVIRRLRDIKRTPSARDKQLCGKRSQR